MPLVTEVCDARVAVFVDTATHYSFCYTKTQWERISVLPYWYTAQCRCHSCGRVTSGQIVGATATRVDTRKEGSLTLVVSSHWYIVVCRLPQCKPAATKKTQFGDSWSIR